MGNKISVKDVGPVVEFEYDMKRPGLHVLRGQQGAGKSTCLRLAQLAADGRTDPKPTKRDGAVAGEAIVGGKRLVITKRIEESGELGVDGLGDLNIADLHTPRFLEPKTRDRHRISTLVRLGGIKAEASMFHSLVGTADMFNKVVSADLLTTDDPVDMGARVKRALEQYALTKEGEQRTALASRQAEDARMAGVDLDAPADANVLQEALQRAIEHRSRLQQQATSAVDANNRAQEARQRLDAIQPGASVADLKQKHRDTEEAVERSAARIQDLERMIATEQERLAGLVGVAGAAATALNSAQHAEAAEAGWRADIEAASKAAAPSPGDLQDAERAVQQTTEAVALGQRVRTAQEARGRREEFGKAAMEFGRKADRARTAAAGVQDVLSGLVAKIPQCPLRVKMDESDNPRLVLKTDRSDDEAFEDLSDGERWVTVMQIAAGANKLIVLPQAAFGELSPETRTLLHKLAVEHGCYVLTAQADDGKLRGEPFSS